MSTIAELEQELAERQDDVNTCNEMLELDPEEEDALQTKAMLEEQITELRARIAAERRKQNDAPPPPPADDAPPPPPKFDMSKHPKYQQSAGDTPPPPPSEDAPAVFEIKDVVMAKFSEDRQWYQATITSKTGSSTDPVYTVNYKGYGNTETKRKYEIRAIDNRKRKAEGPPGASTTPQAPASPARPNPIGTISAAPAVDTTLVQKREPSKVSDGPTRMAPEPKKLKGNKALDKQKSSWNDWQKNGPKKAFSAPKKKDSQFRTQDGINAKVGFVGSGKPMSKDQERSKWKYGQTMEDDQ